LGSWEPPSELPGVITVMSRFVMLEPFPLRTISTCMRSSGWKDVPWQTPYEKSTL
jgi:hypothetical protein